MIPLLRPGLRLMRALRVKGKFAVITALLVVPLSVSIVAGFVDATGQLSFSAQEQRGVRYAGPLVRLIIDVAQARDTAADLHDTVLPSTADAQAAVDAADQRYGSAFAVHQHWLEVRQELAVLGRPVHGRTPADLLAATARAQEDLLALLEHVADASNLILDPELDSYYVMIAMVDRLPRMVLDASELRSGGSPLPAAPLPSLGQPPTPDPFEVRISLRDLQRDAARLAEDLLTATANTHSPELTDRIGRPTADLRTAVRGVNAATLEPAPVFPAARVLAGALVPALDSLLREREARLADQRGRPVLFALTALLAAAYLLAALYRAVAQDVRAVLTGINGVTSSEPHTYEPLAGSDEFAEMSRAVVVAQDRLTEVLGELSYKAYHDELTKLANRALFLEKLNEALANRSGPIAVMLVNLDGFREVNASFGHDLGDRLLCAVGARFHRAVGRRDLIARLGADEFAVLLGGAADVAELERQMSRVRASLDEPVNLDGRQLHVQAGIGVAIALPEQTRALDLMRDADVAKNVAKASGKGRLTMFEPAMHEQARERTELSADLVATVAAGQLEVYYQPIVELHSGRVHGLEALVRWQHPTRGPISPAVFIPLAEASGMIVPLGRWVLQAAVRQLATWRSAFPDRPPLTLDVNLSADQLADPSLVGEVLSLIDETGIDPTELVLEITESGVVKDLPIALRRLGQLSAMGVRLALDDFGTGYSSLSYLQRLPVSGMKIDKSFVDRVADPDGQAAALLRSIVNVGLGMGLEIVAEGVESPDQVRPLLDAGCHLAQGYLWSRPLPADQLTALLERGGPLGPPPPAPAGDGSVPAQHIRVD